MHAWGVTHGDLKGSNLLVVETEGGVKTYVIDMDGVQISRHAPPSGCVGDLARLATSLQAHPWVPRTVCCRFLRAYARQFPPGTIAWKELWHKAERASRRITGRKRRRKEVVL
jgi:tRNA A-37 threonylcarbamoyl transferase component Bud32